MSVVSNKARKTDRDIPGSVWARSMSTANYPPRTYRRGWGQQSHPQLRIIMNISPPYLRSKSCPRSHQATKAHHHATGQVKQVFVWLLHNHQFFRLSETEGQTSAPEADVLVMAFQEADLSTEAFFNFTGAAREDAWTDAIFSALGERTERYEKVIRPWSRLRVAADCHWPSSYLNNS